MDGMSDSVGTGVLVFADEERGREVAEVLARAWDSLSLSLSLSPASPEAVGHLQLNADHRRRFRRGLRKRFAFDTGDRSSACVSHAGALTTWRHCCATHLSSAFASRPLRGLDGIGDARNVRPREYSALHVGGSRCRQHSAGGSYVLQSPWPGPAVRHTTRRGRSAACVRFRRRPRPMAAGDPHAGRRKRQTDSVRHRRVAAHDGAMVFPERTAGAGETTEVG